MFKCNYNNFFSVEILKMINKKQTMKIAVNPITQK